MTFLISLSEFCIVTINHVHGNLLIKNGVCYDEKILKGITVRIHQLKRAGWLGLIFLNNLYAANGACPPIEEIKQAGNHFLNAYAISDYNWVLPSDLFYYQNQFWMVRYVIHDKNIQKTEDAFRAGQISFKEAISLAKPASMQESNIQTVCRYHSPRAFYDIMAMTPASVESWLRLKLRNFIIF